MFKSHLCFLFYELSIHYPLAMFLLDCLFNWFPRYIFAEQTNEWNKMNLKRGYWIPWFNIPNKTWQKQDQIWPGCGSSSCPLMKSPGSHIYVPLPRTELQEAEVSGSRQAAFWSKELRTSGGPSQSLAGHSVGVEQGGVMYTPRPWDLISSLRWVVSCGPMYFRY